jgi:hypothetical protein
MTAGGRRLDGKIIESAVIVLTRWLAGGCGRWAGCAPSEATRIYIANHTSHADLPLILGAMPAHLREHTSVVAAADYWCAGIVRRYVAEHAFRTILIRRDHTGRRQFEQMTDALDHGESLILFPEGTRGSGEHLQPLKCRSGSKMFAVSCLRALSFLPQWNALCPLVNRLTCTLARTRNPSLRAFPKWL